MNLFKKLFGGSTTKKSSEPDNTKLISLLDIYAEQPSNENYKSVVSEIINGNAFLLLPSVNDKNIPESWETTKVNTTLNLTSVFNLDGLKVLGAFSDESALVAWSKRETEYTALRTQDITTFCQEHNIDRIVINSDQKNMFVLERNRDNITPRTIQEETEVLVGTPIKPLPKAALELLSQNFRKVDTIEEAYQFAQMLNNETSLVLGIKMSIVSDNSKAALHNALNDSLGGVDIGIPIDIMMLEDEGWLNTVRNIENTLFYKKH
jgi:hypothetical protein